MEISKEMQDQYNDVLVDESLDVLKGFLNRAHLYLIKLWTPFNRVFL